MNVVMVAVIGTGVVGMLIGYLTRRQRGRFLLFCGAGLIVGPMSPLLKGRVTETVQTLLTSCAIVLSLAGLVTALIEVRRRRAHRGDDSYAH